MTKCEGKKGIPHAIIPLDLAVTHTDTTPPVLQVPEGPHRASLALPFSYPDVTAWDAYDGAVIVQRGGIVDSGEPL